jgi:hypothetical protein
MIDKIKVIVCLGIILGMAWYLWTICEKPVEPVRLQVPQYVYDNLDERIGNKGYTVELAYVGRYKGQVYIERVQ